MDEDLEDLIEDASVYQIEVWCVDCSACGEHIVYGEDLESLPEACEGCGAALNFGGVG